MCSIMFFFSSRRRHTRSLCDWSSDVCSSDLPPIFFPIVTEGAREIVDTYRMFAPAAHAEFLIDRQGYLRAIAAAGGDGTRDPNLLVAEVQQLNKIGRASCRERVWRWVGAGA